MNTRDRLIEISFLAPKMRGIKSLVISTKWATPSGKKFMKAFAAQFKGAYPKLVVTTKQDQK